MKKIIIWICLTTVYLGVNAQGADVWYFGENAGLDFTSNPPTVIAGITGVDGSAGLMEMAATISDDDGNFLFAVSGNDIYSADLAKRGSTHSSDNAGETSQGAMIIPVPGTTDEYYVTTVPYGTTPCNSGSPGFTRVKVNGITGNNITIVSETTLPTSNIAHGQMIIPKTDAITGEVLDEFWLYHHERNSNKFFRYSIENGGIVFDQAIDGGGPSFNQTQCADAYPNVINFMKSNGCYNQFVIGNGDNVYMFDIDASTGDINYQNSAGPITQAYGIEFSASGKNVFVSTGTTGGLLPRPIYKIPVSPGGLTGSTLGSLTQIGTMSVQRAGGMQMAPDGNIYIGGMTDWNGTPKDNYLGVISDPDGSASFDPQGVKIPNSIIAMGMPAIPASLVSNVANIQFQTGCKGEPIDFSYTFSGTEQTPEVRLWQFFPGSTTSGLPVKSSGSKTETNTWNEIGTYAVTLEVNDVCGRKRFDTAYVVIDELEVDLLSPDSVCPEETTEFVALGDPSKTSKYKWFNAEFGGAELGVGTTLEETLVKDSVCVWVEPDGVVDGPFFGGHSGNKGYGAIGGAAGDHQFNALKPIKIDGFTVTGGSWSSGSDNITIVVKLGGATIAGPATVAMQKMGDTKITGLNFAIPQGFGYSIEITGGSYFPIADGTGLSNVDGILAVSESNILQDWEVYEMNPCFARKRICAYELECECRDTNLLFADELCVDTLYDLNTLLTDTTYQDGQWSIVSGPGTIENDSILNIGLNDDGNIEVRYDVYFGADAPKDGCPDSNVRIITVNPRDVADIIDGQGPFCVDDANPILNLSSETPTGGRWSLLATTDANIDGASGEINLTDSGTIQVVYTTDGDCPNADTIDILIHPKPDVEVLTPDTSMCLGANAFQLRLTVSSDDGGNWVDSIGDNAFVSNTGLFDPAGLAAGDYTVKYVMNGFNGACSDSDSVVVTINTLDSTEIINLPSLCNSDPAIQLQLNPGLTITGTWSDSLGLVSYVDASGLFDPAGLTDGQVMVVFKTDGACGYSDTAYVTVTSNIEYSMDHITNEYCLNADQDTILVSPGGGTFWTTSGTGIVDADYGYWDPKLYSSDGIDTIWYGKAGACGDTVFIEVTLNPIDLVEIDSAIAVCADEAAFDYTLSGASTTGGTWSGTGITDDVLGTFDPAAAGAGIHTIAYQSPNTCLVIDSVHILVKPRVEVSIDSLALPFCGASTALSATGNLHLGLGRWENSASWPVGWDTGKTENDSILTFDPNVVTPGIDSIFYMIDANAFVCGDTATLLIGISPMEVAEIDTVTEVCSSYAPFDYTLSPLSTPNGTWSGVGIVDGLLGTFDPTVAGPGVHTIRYKTPGVCFVWDSLTITVVKQEIISLTGGKSYCGNALPGVIDANQAGGVFFGGWDVAALGVVNDSSRTFDPTLAGGTGVDSIFYGIDAQCGDTTWLEIAIDTVDIPDIDGANESAFCQTDNPKVVTLMSTATPGGVWQDFGGGNALITTGGLFEPSIGKGIYQVVYTTPGSCFTTDTHSIEVVSEIIVDVDKTLPDTIFCNNASPYDLTSFLLPTTSGDGSGSWKITPFISGGVVSNNQLVPTALVPGVYSLKYALGSGACSDSDSVSIRILPILDPTIDNEPAADVCVSLKNYQFNNSGDNGGVWSVDPTATIDVVTGDLTLKGGTFEVKYTLGTTCPVDSTVKIVVQEPNNPTIQDPGTICGYDVAFALITTGDAGGAWSGSGVSGANFDPAVSGEGTFAINYAFTGTCPIDSTFDFVVDPVLDPTIDNEPAEDICIADGSYAFTTSGDIGGTWSIDNGGVIDASTGVMNLTKGGFFDVTYKHTGCPIEDVVTIEVTTPGNPDFDPAGSFCENLPVYQLSEPLTPGGVWSSLPIAGAVDPVTGEFDPGVAGPGSHDVTYTLEGACPAFDTEIIVIDDLPDWDYVIPNANGCEPYTTSMIVVSQGDLPETTTWSFTDGLVTTTNGAVDSLTHTFVNDGCYNGTAVVAFENGCIDSVTKTNAVCVNPVPIADFDWGPKSATVLEPFIQFEDLSIDADSWNWDLGRVSTTNIPPNPTASTLQNPFVTYGSPDSGTYTVELIAWNGMCSDTIIKRITILDNFTVFVPNAFTPDGDGLNDIFFPNGKNHDNIEGASEYSFLIFNRWGALIWESGTPYQPWDGTNAKTGSEVQQDVYVWKLKVWDNVESVLKTYYGRVSLIR